MARQTSINGGGQRPETMLEGVEAFGTNLATLAGLQARLAAHDFRAAMAISTPALITLGVVLLMAAAGSVVGLIGLAIWIAATFEMTTARAFLFTALAAFLLSGLAATLAIRRLRAGLVIFRRSNEELQRNLAWLGTVLAHSGR